MSQPTHAVSEILTSSSLVELTGPVRALGKSHYNDIALRLAHKLFGLSHLHYGYFMPGVAATLQNLPQAQNAYVDHLLACIPSGVRSILDVGCGTGSVAKRLLEANYAVTCVDRDPFMISKMLSTAGPNARGTVSAYQSLNLAKAHDFDLVLMSESCQYVPIAEAWQQHAHNTRDGGYVLIADFFKVKPIDRPYLSKSGHARNAFLAAANAAGFEEVSCEDITEYVAPTMAIYQAMITDKVFPIGEAGVEYVSRRYPWAFRAMRSIWGKKVSKLREKYSHQDAATFAEYKRYLVWTFKKK